MIRGRRLESLLTAGLIFAAIGMVGRGSPAGQIGVGTLDRGGPFRTPVGCRAAPHHSDWACEFPARATASLATPDRTPGYKGITSGSRVRRVAGSIPPQRLHKLRKERCAVLPGTERVARPRQRWRSCPQPPANAPTAAPISGGYPNDRRMPTTIHGVAALTRLVHCHCGRLLPSGLANVAR